MTGPDHEHQWAPVTLRHDDGTLIGPGRECSVCKVDVLGTSATTLAFPAAIVRSARNFNLALGEAMTNFTKRVNENRDAIRKAVEAAERARAPEATAVLAAPMIHERDAEVPDWHCTDSARGEGWGSRDECPYCDKEMWDGSESVTEDAMIEHFAECPGLAHDDPEETSP